MPKALMRTSYPPPRKIRSPETTSKKSSEFSSSPHGCESSSKQLSKIELVLYKHLIDCGWLSHMWQRYLSYSYFLSPSMQFLFYKTFSELDQNFEIDRLKDSFFPEIDVKGIKKFFWSFFKLCTGQRRIRSWSAGPIPS